jgi:hypothetical protein
VSRGEGGGKQWKGGRRKEGGHQHHHPQLAETKCPPPPKNVGILARPLSCLCCWMFGHPGLAEVVPLRQLVAMPKCHTIGEGGRRQKWNGEEKAAHQHVCSGDGHLKDVGEGEARGEWSRTRKYQDGRKRCQGSTNEDNDTTGR